MTLVVPADGPGALDGAGVLSSVADVGTALESGDPSYLAAAVDAAAVDLLGAVMDPLGSLLEGAAGWVIEHVWFLREPLDALAGDPNQVKAQSHTWRNASRALLDVAQRYPRDAAAVPWTGAAADEYRAAVGDYAHHLGRAAGAAHAASVEIMASAAAVGTVRAIIRDVVAEFVATAIERALFAMATAVPTSGGSLAAFATVVVLEAVDLANDNVRRITRLLADLDAAALRLAEVEKVVQRVRAVGTEAEKQSGEARWQHRTPG